MLLDRTHHGNMYTKKYPKLSPLCRSEQVTQNSYPHCLQGLVDRPDTLRPKHCLFSSTFIPVNIYLSRDTRKGCETCSKLTVRHQNDVNNVVLVFLLLTLNIFQTFSSVPIVDFEHEFVYIGIPPKDDNLMLHPFKMFLKSKSNRNIWGTSE